MRVLLVGAHATGKTTLARWIRDTYGLPLLTEVARTVLAEREDRLPKIAGDLPAVTSYQEEVFRRQVTSEQEWAERYPAGYVSDRAMDNLAYAAWRGETGTAARLLREPEAIPYLERLRSARVFFVRPHRALLRDADDGVRADVDWETVLRLDGAVLMLLEVLDVRYVPISCLEASDRARVVAGVLGPPALPLAPGGSR